MRVLSLFVLGAASVSAGPDAIDEILRKLAANDTNATTAAAQTQAAGGNATDSPTTAAATQAAQANATQAAQTQAAQTQAAQTAAVTQAAQTAAVTQAAGGNATAQTAAVTQAAQTAAVTQASNNEGQATAAPTTQASNSTGNSTGSDANAAEPKRKIASSSEVAVNLPFAVTDTAKLSEFSCILGNSFGDVICAKISGTGKAFDNENACKCTAVCTAGTSKNADDTHKCGAAVSTRRRRAQAARMLSGTTTFTTTSAVEKKMTATQGNDLKTLVEAVATDNDDMAAKMKVALTDRLTSDATPGNGLAALAANLTSGLTAKKPTATVEVVTTTTAGAVAAASTGFGLLLAALLF